MSWFVTSPSVSVVSASERVDPVAPNGMATGMNCVPIQTNITPGPPPRGENPDCGSVKPARFGIPAPTGSIALTNIVYGYLSDPQALLGSLKANSLPKPPVSNGLNGSKISTSVQVRSCMAC